MPVDTDNRPKKPTIHELEAILAEPGDDTVVINPDGSVSVLPKRVSLLRYHWRQMNVSEQHMYPYQCEGEDCPLCCLDAEIERLQALHLERTKTTHKALTERDEKIERLEGALREMYSAENYEQLCEMLDEALDKEQT